MDSKPKQFVLPILWLGFLSLASPLVGGTVQVVNGAQNSGVYGLRILVDDQQPAYVRDNSPNGDTQYRARFYLRMDALTMADGDAFVLFSARNAAGNDLFSITMQRTAGKNDLILNVNLDGGGVSSSTAEEIPAGYHALEIHWHAGDGDGHMHLWLDGRRLTGLEGLDNGQAQLDHVMLGVVNGVALTTTGSFDFDDFVSQRFCYVGMVGCDANCQFQNTIPSWPLGGSLLDLVYFLADPCYD